jgi:hypothetical protein
MKQRICAADRAANSSYQLADRTGLLWGTDAEFYRVYWVLTIVSAPHPQEREITSGYVNSTGLLGLTKTFLEMSNSSS